MSIPAQISPEELHLLYILLDSNLPTGGFVSSSGLESYVKHGFLGHPSYSASDPTSDPNNDTKEFSAVKGTKDIIRGVTDFAEAEVGHYANTTGCFVRDSWTLVNSFLSLHPRENDDGERLRTILGKVEELDGYHESTLLSHVARRASKAQGVAMLTLFGRGLTRPVGFEPDHGEDEGQVEDERVKEKKSKDLIDAYKLLVRKGSVPGHLAICWGIITAALGLALGEFSHITNPSSFLPSLLSSTIFLPLSPVWNMSRNSNTHPRFVAFICDAQKLTPDRSIHLYLFLHARSLLSTAVRMNIIGPYASSQMLLHPFKDIIERETANLNDGLNETNTTGLLKDLTHGSQKDDSFWGWTEEAELGPATTWPLGELLTARHDMQHSRIFNS
jgi:urease accessory protein